MEKAQPTRRLGAEAARTTVERPRLAYQHAVPGCSGHHELVGAVRTCRRVDSPLSPSDKHLFRVLAARPKVGPVWESDAAVGASIALREERGFVKPAPAVTGLVAVGPERRRAVSTINLENAGSIAIPILPVTARRIAGRSLRA